VSRCCGEYFRDEVSLLCQLLIDCIDTLLPTWKPWGNRQVHKLQHGDHALPISGPMQDRINIYIEMPCIDDEKLSDDLYLSTIALMPEVGTGIVLLSNANILLVSKAIVHLLHGEIPEPVRLFSSWKFLYWTIWLAPLVMILGIWYSRCWW